MRDVLRCVGLCALLLVSCRAAAWCQDVTGELEGWISDPSGSPLAEALVTVEGTRLQLPRTASSDPRGYFRVAAVPSGDYTVQLRLIGRRPLTMQRVTVSLGQTTTLGLLRLEPEAVELPEITVAAHRAVIDPTSTALATNLRAEDFSLLPVERNFRSIVALAPQANASFFGDETNIAGSSGGENAYFIDGVNATDLQFGATSINLPYNFVQEIQIKTGGYEAEYGRALGGIVNVVTPSGGNTLQGEVYAFLTQDELRSRARLGLSDVGVEEFSQYDVGASVGGPIQRDRLWFYAAYNPTFDNRDASVPGSGALRDEKTVHLFAGKLTWQAAATTNVTLTLLGDPSRHDAIGFFGGGAGAVTSPDPILGKVKEGGTSIALHARTLARRDVLLQASLSRSTQTRNQEPATVLGASLPRLDDLETGISSGGYGGFDRNHLVRTAATVSASLGLGAHDVKLGVEYEDNLADETLRLGVSQPGGFIIRADESSFTWQQVALGGRAHNRIPTVYAQDSWQVRRRLRLNAGLRWESQYLIGSDGDLAQPITGEFQPRLGAIYLPGELGTQRLFASWGRFYEQLPLVLATSYYGEGLQLLIDYPQNPLVSTEGADTFAIPLGGAPRVDGLHGESYDEFTLGYERQVGRGFKLGARGIHRRLRWAIEDGFDPVQERFVIGNPGVGGLATFPRATRTYSGLELTVERLGDAEFTFLASYVLSRTRGNYTGLFASDILDGGANVSAQFDFAEQLASGTGLLPNDRTHVLKFFGAYRFDFGLTTGASIIWESGTPLNEYGGIPVGPPYWSFIRPRGTAGRTGSIWDLDLRFTYAVPIGRRPARPQVVLDLFNVGSPRRAVGVDQVHFTGVDEAGNPVNPNLNYGEVTQYQPPMSARLGLVVGLP